MFAVHRSLLTVTTPTNTYYIPLIGTAQPYTHTISGIQPVENPFTNQIYSHTCAMCACAWDELDQHGTIARVLLIK